MKKFFVAALMILFVASTVNATVETYEGTDEYYVLGAVEDINVARERARENAIRVAREKAGVYIHSYSQSEGSELVVDEIISIASGVLQVIDTVYDVIELPNKEGYFFVVVSKSCDCLQETQQK